MHLLVLLQILFCPGSLQPNEKNCTECYLGRGYEWQYSHLFAELEETLLNNKTLMNLLRQIVYVSVIQIMYRDWGTVCIDCCVLYFLQFWALLCQDYKGSGHDGQAIPSGKLT